MVDKTAIQQEVVDKWSTKPTLAGKRADIIILMDNTRNTFHTYYQKSQKGGSQRNRPLLL